MRRQSFRDWKNLPKIPTETEILKLKIEVKLSHADACKAHRTARDPPVPSIALQSAFPSLGNSTVDRSHARPFTSAAPLLHVTGVPLDQDELIVAEQNDFSSFLFGNPVTFLAFLAEAIKQTILEKDKHEHIDVC